MNFLTLRGVGTGAEGHAKRRKVKIKKTPRGWKQDRKVGWEDRAEDLFTMLREGEPIEEPPPGTDGEPSGG